MKFNMIVDEGLRLAANMETRYDAWLQASRAIADGRLQWKTSGGHDYLYRIIDSKGNGTSLGPRSPATEAMMESFQNAKLTVQNTWATLEREGKMYRSLRLLALHPMAPRFCESWTSAACSVTRYWSLAQMLFVRTLSKLASC